MSLQQLITKFIFKLPDGLLVRMAGGKPVEARGRVLEPQLQLVAWNGRNAPPMSSLEPEVVQAAVKEQLAMLEAPLEPGVTTEDFTIPGPDRNDIPVRLYTPTEQDSSVPLLVYYHMGGGVVGDLETCNAWCSILACVTKGPVLSVDYRLAPQNKFPAGIDDCIAAYEWGVRNAGKYGAPEGVAAVGGDSMGGNFSAIISQEMQREHKPLPVYQLLIYPAVDMVEEFPSRTEFGETFSLSTDTMNWFMDQYLPADFNMADPLLSPGQTAELDSLPPAIVITAGHDPLCDEGDDYAKRLDKAGVKTIHKRYDTLPHAFTAFTGFSPGSRKACLEIANMVKDLVSKL
jgi:acetyl esterase/lipase